MPRYRAAAGRSAPLQVETLEDRFVLSSAAYVTALYQDLLHRNPAPAEVANYVVLLDGGTDAGTVALRFTNSPEYQSNLVRGDYETLLGREPSPAEIGGWVGALQSGASENQVEAAFLASDEFFARHGGSTAPWLDGIYHDVLGRQADQGGLAAWTLTLQNGASRQQVALGIATSMEADLRLTTAAYLDILQRTPDPGGLAGWVAALQNGLSPSGLRAALASSDEYIQLRAPGGLDAPDASLPPPDSGYVPPSPDGSGLGNPIVFDPGIPGSDPAAPSVPSFDPGIPSVDPGVPDVPSFDPGIDSSSYPAPDAGDCGCE